MTDQEPKRQPVTGDDIARLDAALETTQGNRAHAAQMLGWAKSRIENIINDREPMRVKWGHRRGPVPTNELSDEIDRPETTLPQFSREEKKAALAIAKQDALLEGTWEKTGFSKEQREFLSTLQTSYALNLRSTVDLTYGGMVHTSTRLLMVFEDLVKKIKHIDDHPEEYERTHRSEFGENTVKSAHEFRCELYDRLIHISGEMRKVHTDVTKAQYVRAQLEALRRGSSPNAKGGFGQGAPPMAVQVNVNASKVEVAVPDAKPVD